MRQNRSGAPEKRVRVPETYGTITAANNFHGAAYCFQYVMLPRPPIQGSTPTPSKAPSPSSSAPGMLRRGRYASSGNAGILSSEQIVFTVTLLILQLQHNSGPSPHNNSRQFQ